MANFERFQVKRHKAVHLACPLHYQQIGTFRSVVKCLEYTADALFIHRFEPPPL